MSEAISFTCDWCGTREPELPLGLEVQHSRVELVLRGGRLTPQGVAHSAPEEDGSERWGANLCDRCTKRMAGLLDLVLLTPLEVERQLRMQGMEAAAFAKGGVSFSADGMRVQEPAVVRPADPVPPPAAQYSIPPPPPPIDLTRGVAVAGGGGGGGGSAGADSLGSPAKKRRRVSRR